VRGWPWQRIIYKTAPLGARGEVVEENVPAWFKTTISWPPSFPNGPDIKYIVPVSPRVLVLIKASSAAKNVVDSALDRSLTSHLLGPGTTTDPFPLQPFLAFLLIRFREIMRFRIAILFLSSCVRASFARAFF